MQDHEALGGRSGKACEEKHDDGHCGLVGEDGIEVYGELLSLVIAVVHEESHAGGDRDQHAGHHVYHAVAVFLGERQTDSGSQRLGKDLAEGVCCDSAGQLFLGQRAGCHCEAECSLASVGDAVQHAEEYDPSEAGCRAVSEHAQRVPEREYQEQHLLIERVYGGTGDRP